MLLAFGFQGNYQGCHGKLLTTVIGSKDFNNASLALFSPQIYSLDYCLAPPAPAILRQRNRLPENLATPRGICKEKNACFSGKDRHNVKLYMQNAVKEMCI